MFASAALYFYLRQASLSMPANIRLVKNLLGTNTLAYCAAVSVRKKKGAILTPGTNVIKLFWP